MVRRFEPRSGGEFELQPGSDGAPAMVSMQNSKAEHTRFSLAVFDEKYGQVIRLR